MKPVLRITPALLATFVLFGCASAKQEAEPGQAAAQPKDEYVDYTPIGSWVPKKVKKSQLKPTENQADQTRDAMRDLQRPLAPGEKKS